MEVPRFKLAALVSLLCVSGCGGTNSAHFQKFVRTVPPASEAAPVPWTGEFWLVADAQFHNVAGMATRSRAEIPDRIAKVAIRPPSLDLWTDGVLSSVLEDINKTGRHAPVLFLGDAANISCLGEFEHFLETMRSSTWLGVLGNHDGYYMGNFTYPPESQSSGPAINHWQGACNRGGLRDEELKRRLSALESSLLLHGQGGYGLHAEQGTMTKAHAVWLYLNDLKTRGVINKDALDPTQWDPEGDRLVFNAKGAYEAGGQSHPIAVVAAIPRLTAGDALKAWQAFVLQDVELPGGVHAILLDTSDYLNVPPSGFVGVGALTEEIVGCAHAPNNNSLPGACGEINVVQIDQLKALMKNWAQGERFFLLGHHPWEKLRRDTTNRLKEVMESPQFIAYLSAHTHFPAATTGDKGHGQWEVNIGSTTDWPMEFARVNYGMPADSGAGSGFAIDVRRIPTMVRQQKGACIFAGSREESAAEVDYDTVEKYARRALNVYARLMAAIPENEQSLLTAALPQRSCAPQESCFQDLASALKYATEAQVEPVNVKLEALDRLRVFDRNVLRQSAWVRQAEVNCAIWASEEEFRKNGRRSDSLKDSERLQPGLETFRTEPPPGSH